MDMVALELIKNLQVIDTENEYVIFVKPDEDNQCLKETTNFNIIQLEAGNYVQWEQNALPAAAKKQGCQLLHCTSNTAPLKNDIPLVVTLHDIIYMEKFPLLAPGFNWYQRLGNTYRRYVVPKMVKKADKIITVSNFEKERIAGFFNLDDSKLSAVYNGVGEHFRVIEDENELKRIQLKYQLPPKYLFFLGNTDPKKNTPGVLKAYAIFCRAINEDIPLVMPDCEINALKKILNSIGEPGLLRHIQLTGYISNHDLPAIYNQCDIFLYPSKRESFGIPILEGMACGVPVITSTTSSMPEVSGDAASLVNPDDPEEIAKAMHTLLQTEEILNERVAKGLERAKQFSWKNTAIETKKVYESVLR